MPQIAVLVFSILFFVTCSEPPSSPKVIAIAFWSSVGQNDLATAKQLAIKGSMDGVSLGKLKQLELKEEEISGITAIVPTILTSERGGKEEKLIFNTALAQVDGIWKVDFRKTMTNMVGINIQKTLESLGKVMEEGIAKPMEKSVTEIGRALERGIKEMGAALNEGKSETTEERPRQVSDSRKSADAAYKNKDYGTALREYTLAAEEDVYSQYMVAFLYSMNFKGVGEDFERAFLWASIAAANGSENALLLKKMISEDITPTRISEIETLAKRCADQKYKNCSIDGNQKNPLPDWKKTKVVDLTHHLRKRIKIQTKNGIVREGILHKAEENNITIRQGRIGSNLTFEIPYENVTTIKIWR